MSSISSEQGKHQDERVEQVHVDQQTDAAEGVAKLFSYKRLVSKVEPREFIEEALAKYGQDGAIPPEAERRLKRKLDRIIIPLIGICYAFYYVDKTTLSYAAIFGIKDPKPQGLGLHGTQYSTLSSIFYAGWLVAAYPQNLLMQRCNTATYLGVNIFLWGLFLAAQAGAKSFADMVGLRVISGAAEAIADPAFMLLTASFYTREEQPFRISMWYSFNGIGVACGGLLGFAIGHIKGALPSWKYEFIIIGAACCLWGIIIIFFMPASPATTIWLNREERLMAVARLRRNQTGIANIKFKRDQFIEWATDIKTYMFLALGFFANIPNAGISNFSTLVIKGMGFNTLQTALLGIPQGALVVIYIMTGAFINGRCPKNYRTIVSAAFMIPTIAGALGFLLAPTHAYTGRLICFYLTGSYQTTFVLSLSLITSNTGGHTKKMLTSASIWFGASLGNLVGPYFYKTSQAPTYRLGIGSLLVANCIELGIILLLRFVLIYENKKKAEQRAARAAEEKAQGLPSINETSFADLTDKQNINFEYVY